MTGLLAMDREGHYVPAMRLLGRLAFDQMQWHAVNVRSPFTPMGTPFSSADEVVDDLERDRADSEQFMEDQLDHLCHYDISPHIHVMEGPVAASVLQLADSVHSNLVAVGSRNNGPLASVLLGSVGRALAIGARQSLLIGRGVVAPNGTVSAIFATDHSYYAIRALDHLIAMKPKGLRSVKLLTAYDESELTETAYFAELTKEAKHEGLCLKEKIKLMSEAAARKLRAAGYVADYDLKPGKVRDVIHHAMNEHKADLLILGAQGHGFFDRVKMGSVALQQVVSEPHSLLVVRP